MSRPTYQPRPIDTSGVSLDALQNLVERLAENTHEVWASQRIRDGWRWGPKRDDAHKEHPCLIPYGELPDSEKEYDRLAAEETIKVLLALGYRIEPPPKEKR